MNSYNLDGYLPIFILMVIGIVVVLGGYGAAWLLSPKKPTKLKDTIYECGEETVGKAWSSFNVRFYVVGLIFIIFDVESTLMFPVAAVFKQFHEIGEGLPVLIILLLFISLLVEGIVYCWKKGDLDWVRTYNEAKPKKSDPSIGSAKESVAQE